MFSRTFVLALSLSLGATAVLATCSAQNKCGADVPCCGTYGYCFPAGHAACSGGCNPFGSATVDACQPNPVCKNVHLDLTSAGSQARIQTDYSKWNNDADAYDFVLEQGQIVPQADASLMTIHQSDLGTLLSSARYFLYGTFEITLKTTNANGIVTAAIGMSDVKDEVDLEFPGSVVDQVQNVAWWQGKIGGSSFVTMANVDRHTTFITYKFEWTKDAITWTANGKEVYKLTAEQATSDGQRKFPATPMRLQMSVWNGNGNAWAGGDVDWSKADPTNGFYSQIQSVKITCAPDANVVSGVTGYRYTSDLDANKNPVIRYVSEPLVYGSTHASSSSPASSQAASTADNSSAAPSSQAASASVPAASSAAPTVTSVISAPPVLVSSDSASTVTVTGETSAIIDSAAASDASRFASASSVVSVSTVATVPTSTITLSSGGQAPTATEGAYVVTQSADEDDDDLPYCDEIDATDSASYADYCEGQDCESSTDVAGTTAAGTTAAGSTEAATTHDASAPAASDNSNMPANSAPVLGGSAIEASSDLPVAGQITSTASVIPTTLASKQSTGAPYASYSPDASSASKTSISMVMLMVAGAAIF